MTGPEPERDAGSAVTPGVQADVTDDAGDEPPGLVRARAVATILDDAVRVPVIDYRIGLDPIVGVLPIAGDTAVALASLYVVLEGVRLGVPPRTAAKMVALVALDWAVGSIPVVGTLVDAVLKVNRRNVSTIERHVSRSTADSVEVPVDS